MFTKCLKFPLNCLEDIRAWRYLFPFCQCHLSNLDVLRRQKWRRGQTLLPRWGGKDPEELAATETQSHLSGSDRRLRYRPLHGVPQRAGRYCTGALHLIVHSYGRVIASLTGLSWTLKDFKRLSFYDGFLVCLFFLSFSGTKPLLDQVIYTTVFKEISVFIFQAKIIKSMCLSISTL